jgi:gliding motility-associated protein GldC
MTTDDIQRTSTIKFDVHLDKENLPVSIDWTADDGEFGEPQAAKAIMIGLWDGLQKEAMRIDLWTKEMSVEEMNHFTFQFLMTMADNFERATGNAEAANVLREASHEFGHKADVFGPDHQH